ncbi:MAG: PD40 domain-containing protein [Acidobacteria bacterium]|nr:PD40 domain-containing protein [Acidobacteriota bacterium]
MVARGRDNDVWLVDERGSTSRFSFGGGQSPLWSTDGRHLLYRSNQGSLVRRIVSGAEKEQEIGTTALAADYPTDWSPDGRLVLLHTLGRASNWDITTLSVEDGTRMPLIQTPTNEIQARLSPDERWLAYSSDESGRWEVYVQPFPLTGAKWQISMDGGSQPVWRRDGQELFFLGADSQLMAVTIQTAGGFAAGAPHALFQTRVRPSFEPFPFEYATIDGQRFLINSAEPGPGPTITIVSNWTAGLAR